MAAKTVLILSADEQVSGSSCGALVGSFLEGSGRYHVTLTGQPGEALAKLRDCDAVIVHAAAEGVTAELGAALVRFVKSGKGLLAVHAAAEALQRSPALRDLLGCGVSRQPVEGEFLVEVSGVDHQATRRLGEFVANDVLYQAQDLAADASVLATTDWLGTALPVMYARTVGRGRVFYTGLGGRERQCTDPYFRKSLLHGLDWACRLKQAKGPVRCAMLGYGAAVSNPNAPSSFPYIDSLSSPFYACLTLSAAVSWTSWA